VRVSSLGRVRCDRAASMKFAPSAQQRALDFGRILGGLAESVGDASVCQPGFTCCGPRSSRRLGMRAVQGPLQVSAQFRYQMEGDKVRNLLFNP
jgi:hypothetical protein